MAGASARSPVALESAADPIGAELHLPPALGSPPCNNLSCPEVQPARCTATAQGPFLKGVWNEDARIRAVQRRAGIPRHARQACKISVVSLGSGTPRSR